MKPEDQAQVDLFRYLAYRSGKYPEMSLMFHVPNGGKRTPAEAKIFKAMGVKAGVPDLFLPVARGKYHGLFVELKVGKNKPTPNQLGWQMNLQAQGYVSEVCYGWEQAAELIEAYLNLKE